ncbi:MAG: lysozyme family protein [Moritella sp.]|jgi:lysozyme family protein
MKSIDGMIQDVLNREGGFVDHPDDRGGPTKYGITQKTLSKYYGHAATTIEVKALSIEVAEEIYKRNYYYGPSIDSLVAAIQPFIFDSAVNHGPRRAIKFVQSVCNQAGYGSALTEDGAMGPNTRRAQEWAFNEMGETFLEALIEERKNFYLMIAHSRPSQKVFLKGWMNRVNEFEKETV